MDVFQEYSYIKLAWTGTGVGVCVFYLIMLRRFSNILGFPFYQVILTSFAALSFPVCWNVYAFTVQQINWHSNSY